MIRVLLVLLAMVSLYRPAGAQTFAEWFSQKKTQKKYLLEQIAALEVYVNYARKGYKIVGDGLGLVRDISRGEFSLHDGFLKGLRLVSPVVKGDARVAEVLGLQVDVVLAISRWKALELDALGAAYVSSVSGRVLLDCAQDLEELLSVVLSPAVQLSDDERLLRLESVYQRSLDRSAFVQDFFRQAALQVQQRKSEEKAMENLRRYYGID